jgi:hypothetical protein
MKIEDPEITVPLTNPVQTPTTLRQTGAAGLVIVLVIHPTITAASFSGDAICDWARAWWFRIG